jgi:proteasome lid subunit RPN8/RPN11
MGRGKPGTAISFWMHSVKIKKNILSQMIQHAERESPLECCGLLSGESEVINAIHPMTNRLESSVRFEIEPVELFQFFKNLRKSGKAHLGIYHSHPSSDPHPSPTDIEESFYPDCSYFIVSLKNPRSPEVRAFQLDRPGIKELVVTELE